MPHNFTNCDKIAALQKWVERQREALDRVADAIAEADTMDRWAGVPDPIRNKAVERAIDAVDDFYDSAKKRANPKARIKVPKSRGEAAFHAAYDVTEEMEGPDKDGVITIPAWAVDRVLSALKGATVRALDPHD